MRNSGRILSWVHGKLPFSRKKEAERLAFLTITLLPIEDWLTEYHGDASRLRWITSKLHEFATEDPDASEFILCDKNRNLYLDEEGVLYCFSILKEFFGEEECKSKYQLLRKCNVLPRYYLAVQNTLEGYTDEELALADNYWREYEPANDNEREVRENLLVLAALEKKQRRKKGRRV